MKGERDPGGPAPLERNPPPEDWQHRDLYNGVREAVASLPVCFRTETHISGILATDLHTLNTVLGATIEEQVVRTLNLTRSTRDPHGRYALYSFVRQAQTFPDVLLRRTAGDDILMGIEIKGWHLLAKEAEPSLRFQVTEDACAVQDLIVVVPWVLDNVISGSPILFEPFVESARYAAAHRNHHWQHVRQTRSDTRIEVPERTRPYPRKSDQILDRPIADGGGNFGRLARTGMMDTYMQKLGDVHLCGIDAKYWREFLRTFQEGTTEQQARAAPGGCGEGSRPQPTCRSRQHNLHSPSLVSLKACSTGRVDLIPSGAAWIERTTRASDVQRRVAWSSARPWTGLLAAATPGGGNAIARDAAGADRIKAPATTREVEPSAVVRERLRAGLPEERLPRVRPE